VSRPYRPEDAGAGISPAADRVAEHVRTSCAVRGNHQEPLPSWEDGPERWDLIEQMLEAIRLATPLDADERTADDLLLVLAFRRSQMLVFKVDQTTAELHLKDLCRILHITKLPDGTMLGNDAARSVLAGPHAPPEA
jgi:hypothetical protein